MSRNTEKIVCQASGHCLVSEFFNGRRFRSKPFREVNKRNGNVSPTIPRRDLWLIMSTMKVHENSPIIRPNGRLKLVSAGLAFGGCRLRSVAQRRSGPHSLDRADHVFVGSDCGRRVMHPLCWHPASWIANAATTYSKTGDIGDSDGSMHYERAPCIRRWKQMVRRGVRCAVRGCARAA